MLSLRIADYQACMGVYQQLLGEHVAPILDKLPDNNYAAVIFYIKYHCLRDQQFTMIYYLAYCESVLIMQHRVQERTYILQASFL